MIYDIQMRIGQKGALDAAALLAWTKQQMPQMLRWIQRAVEVESPSASKSTLDRMCELLADEFGALGGAVKIAASATGNHLQVDFEAGKAAAVKNKRGRVLLLGHHDTVWEVGTLRSMPFRVRNGRLWGPGALDMKAGLAQIWFALRALKEVTGELPRPVTVLSVADEEVGSHSSKPLIEKLACKSAAVLVLEPAQGLAGALKTARKGVGNYHVKVQGRAAHAGLDFASGSSAIVELAKQIQVLAKFTDPKRGITVNPGVICGGTRTNVVAAEAQVEVDVRIRRAHDAVLLAKKFRALKPFEKKCRLEVGGGINRPPMERTPAIAALFAKAKSLAQQMDASWQLEEAATGGGSDGNFTAALGIPTLDGLGAVGEGAHAGHESVITSEIARRTALLAALITDI